VGADTGAEALTDNLAAFVGMLMRPGRGNAFATMAAHDLSLSQVRILHLLYWGDHEPAQVEIAEHVGLSVAAAGRAVDALMRPGLVERHADADDRRVRRVVLTPAGRAMVEELAEARRADLRQFVDELDAHERRRLDDALTPIVAARAGATDRPRPC